MKDPVTPTCVLVLLYSGCFAKYHKPSGLETTGNLFHTVLEAERFKITAPAESLTHKELAALWMAVFYCVLIWWNRLEISLVSFIRAQSPFLRSQPYDLLTA